MQIIDADGHINDHACGEEIARYMPKGNQMARPFPELDHLHFRYLQDRRNRIRRRTIGYVPRPDRHQLDRTLSNRVSVGRIMARSGPFSPAKLITPGFTSGSQPSPRLKSVALIPFQNVEAGIAELRRAVKELGMLGGMLPSNGEAIQGHLGNKIYWPLYAEAEKLGCALAVHVGCLHHMGLDSFSTYYPAHALGHPFSLMIQAAGMLAHGVFERFPCFPFLEWRDLGTLLRIVSTALSCSHV
jgi:hypothetical protein